MALRVAFDLDGTVADMASVLRQHASALFGTELTASKAGVGSESADRPPGAGLKNPGDAAPTTVAMNALRLTPRQQQRLWDHVSTIQDFWLTLPEMEHGIVARIARAARDRRWELIFLTTRPPTEGQITQAQSQRWLAERGLEYPSVYVVQRSRGRIADALHLDAVVDDRVDNCLDVALESKSKAILVFPGDPKQVPAATRRLGVRVVKSISAALSLLERYDDERRQPTLVRSFNRLLGRETPLSQQAAMQNRRAGERRKSNLGPLPGTPDRRKGDRRRRN